MAEITKVKLDKTDRKILAELDKNCRIATTVLAKKVLKSRQAVEYRISHMIQKGIITSFNTSLNPHKMGYKIYKIYLKLRNIPEEKQRLFSYLKNSGIVFIPFLFATWAMFSAGSIPRILMPNFLKNWRRAPSLLAISSTKLFEVRPSFFVRRVATSSQCFKK